MQDHKLDYHGVLRQLCFFQPSLQGEALDKFIERVLALTPETLTMDRSTASAELRAWLSGYASRILSENPSVDETELEAQRKAANPRFVLRQWVLEEVISTLEKDEEKGKRVLGKVMQMVERPFESWGAEGTRDDCKIGEEETEERRFCGMGAKSMLGFQCSCSS